MKPEIVTIRRHSSPLEYSDPGRPRPPEILERQRLALEVFRTRSRAAVQFEAPDRRRTLRQLERQQVQVETKIRLDDRMSSMDASVRAMDHVANLREQRLRPPLGELRARLERVTRR